jgi:hypothetical protein
MCNAWFAAFSSTPMRARAHTGYAYRASCSTVERPPRRPLLNTTRALALRQVGLRPQHPAIRQPVCGTRGCSSRLGTTASKRDEGRGETQHKLGGSQARFFYAAATDQTGLNVFIGCQRSSATATNLPCCRSLPGPPPYTSGHNTSTSLARHWRNAAELSTHATRV